MSTRAIIVFIGKKDQYSDVRMGYRLYQHSDGYPTHTLPLIRDAIRAAGKLVKGAEVKYSGDTFEVTANMLTGLYIGQSTKLFGMGAKLEESVQMLTAPTVPEGKPRFLWDARLSYLLGDQGDLEWIYIVDGDKQNVDVFGGGYTGDLPEDTIGKGTVDPLIYCERLLDEYREAGEKEIASATRSLKRLGWPVNS